MPVDVSVIIPVYNPGEFIEPCIESLLAQSLPPDRYEVIFVDDGSTDDTPARLDKLAAEAQQVRVFHIPNSGWPGKPRNVGIDNARGEYVYFCDHDDQLTPEALERLVAFARRNDSDIVLGKLVGVGRGAPRQVFKQNVDDAKIIENSLTSNLTPQKLYRKAFLDEHQIRFPEGKRRLEDHVFVTHSYFLAKKISILADYPIYRHIRRDDGGNAAHQRVDPAYYLSFVRETIELIEQHTEPGSEQRLQMLSRPFRHEMLGKLRKRGIVEGDRERQEKWVLGVRQLMLDHFPAGYEDGFPLVTRARAAAVLTGDVDLALSIGSAERSLRAHAKLTGARWNGEAWILDVETQLRFKDGTPLRIVRDEDGKWWPDERLVRRDLLKRPLSKAELRHASTAVVIHHRSEHDEWLVPVDFRAEMVQESDDDEDVQYVVYRGQLTIDPEIGAGGSPLRSGHWDLQLRVAQFGASSQTRLRVPKKRRRGLPRPVVAGTPASAVVPYVTAPGNLAFDSGPRNRSLFDLAARGRRTATTTDGDLHVELNLDVTAAAAPLPVRVALRGGGAPLSCEGNVVRADGGGAELVCSPPARLDGKRPTRRLTVVARLRPKDQPVTVATVTLDRQGRFAHATGSSMRDIPLTERVNRYGRRQARQALGRARHLAGRTRRRMTKAHSKKTGAA